MVLLSLLPPAVPSAGILVRARWGAALGAGGGAAACRSRLLLLHRQMSQRFLCKSFIVLFLLACVFSNLHSPFELNVVVIQLNLGLQVRDVETPKLEEHSEIIFLGTGTSEGIPRVCFKATEPDSRNRRHNTSILVHYANNWGRFNILVDAGKLRTIDAVIITHSHADAIGGLDDLRDWTNNVQPFIPIYVAKRDFEVMKLTHYYLVDTSVVLPGAAVSHLQFNIISEEAFFVHNLKITPLPVWHGKGYQSLGFRFGDICYISDVSEIPEETYALLKDCDLLILDALRPDRSSTTHFGLPKALEEVRKIRPKRALFTGMMHLMDHDRINEDLSKLKELEGLDVQLSYDGLRVPVKL
ncbi:hypothetical protein AXF42_Ash002567 [Apostasia shenzhenica]|uniref:Metallo-beta-lactamase domain-containing protein n=1 Tax=Apostasia shenzhenica TaxID=1088818 RepID=A0A2I0AP04_9ASPA|nr:hypothetical protein AXF42_Ash002567 [Apostasia shenzhenica]